MKFKVGDIVRVKSIVGSHSNEFMGLYGNGKYYDDILPFAKDKWVSHLRDGLPAD